MLARLAVTVTPLVHRRRECRCLEFRCQRCCQDQDWVFDCADHGGGADGPEVLGSPDEDQPVPVGLGLTVAAEDCVHPDAEVALAGDDDVVGVGVLVGDVTGQVDGVGPVPVPVPEPVFVFVFVFVPALASAETGCLVAVAVGTVVADAVPEALAATVVWLGVADGVAVSVAVGVAVGVAPASA